MAVMATAITTLRLSACAFIRVCMHRLTSVCDICHYSLVAEVVSSPELLHVSLTLAVASDNTPPQTEHAGESGPCGKSPVFVLNTRCHCFFKMS